MTKLWKPLFAFVIFLGILSFSSPVALADGGNHGGGNQGGYANHGRSGKGGNSNQGGGDKSGNGNHGRGDKGGGSNHGGGPTHQLPESPYAIGFPIVALGTVAFVLHRKKRKAV